MKKIRIAFVATFLILSNAVIAQVNMGIKGGVNFSTLNESQNFKTGVHAGVLWHVHSSHHFALQPEIVYSMQGVEYSNGDRINLGYVNVPFLFQLMFGNGFRLEAGPQIGFLANARTHNGTQIENAINGFKPLDASLAFGFGFIGRSGFGFDARYNYGISDITKSAGDVYNRVYQVGLFYQFGL